MRIVILKFHIFLPSLIYQILMYEFVQAPDCRAEVLGMGMGGNCTRRGFSDRGPECECTDEQRDSGRNRS